MKRTEYRVHKTLSNGQLLSVYFNCRRNLEWGDGNAYDTWTVGVRVGKGARDNNDWWNKSRVNCSINTTGHCGIEGMMAAKDIIMSFVSVHLPSAQKLVITGTDDRRTRAYAWLKRLGFLNCLYDGAKGYAYEF